jgi:oligosaccharide reducing-end xylanase
MPGDGNGAFKTHEYRDLFAELGHAPAESRAKIEKAFQQLVSRGRAGRAALF